MPRLGTFRKIYYRVAIDDKRFQLRLYWTPQGWTREELAAERLEWSKLIVLFPLVVRQKMFLITEAIDETKPMQRIYSDIKDEL